MSYLLLYLIHYNVMNSGHIGWRELTPGSNEDIGGVFGLGEVKVVSAPLAGDTNNEGRVS